MAQVEFKISSEAIESEILAGTREAMRIERENRLLESESIRNKARIDETHLKRLMEWYDVSIPSIRNDYDKQRLHWLRCFANSVMWADLRDNQSDWEDDDWADKIKRCFDLAEAMLAESERRWEKMQRESIK